MDSVSPRKAPTWSDTISGNSAPRNWQWNVPSLIPSDDKIMSCVCCVMNLLDPRMVQLSQVETSTSTTKKILGCTKLAKMMTPSDCVTEGHRGYHTFDRGGQSREDVNFTSLNVHNLGWWKQDGHHFPTLSRLTRRFLAISATSTGTPENMLLFIMNRWSES